MAKVKFVPNAAGFRELLSSSELSAYLQSKGEAVASAARISAPVESGDYRDSIHVEMVQHPTRIVAQVHASDWKSHIIEADTGNLARALDAAVG